MLFYASCFSCIDLINQLTTPENAQFRTRLLEVRLGSRTAVAGRRMAQPVYPQLRKYPVRPATYVSCHQRHFVLRGRSLIRTRWNPGIVGEYDSHRRRP